MLWDSRTVHCSSAGPGDGGGGRGLLRAVSLVCMMPRRLASAEVLRQRKEGALRGDSTTNWTDRYVSTEAYPEIQASPLSFAKPRPAEMTAERLRLIGYTEDEIRARTPPPAARL